MKKQLLTILYLVIAATLSAQYCGTSGTFTCSSNLPLDSIHFTPNDSIPCIVRGEPTVIDITFTNNSLFLFQVPRQTVRFDSIGLLPDGLCWATNKTNNTFALAETGCIRISGSTFAPPGQYKLPMVFLLDVGAPLQEYFDVLGSIILRVVESNTSDCPPVNELLSIDEVKTDEHLHIYPNPATGDCTINIPETLIGSKLCITNLTGREVISVQLQNTTTKVSTGQLSAGVYIVKCGNSTSKLVVGR